VRPIILASTSRYRRELLARLAIPFEAKAPLIDEEEEKKRLGPVTPEGLARALGRLKAESLGSAFPDALIIGSDQLVELEGEVLGKPHTEENAVRQLLRMSGRTHRLITSIAIHEGRTGRTEEALDIHEVEVRHLSESEARAYVAKDRPLDCAGSYKAEGLGIALFRRLRGDDFTAIVGLPLTKVVELLERFQVKVLAP
jgi:septum formation protein